MKKVGVMIIALLVFGAVLTGCGMVNPLPDTSWVASDADDGTWTLSFTKENFSIEYEYVMGDETINEVAEEGTYVYSSGEIVFTPKETSEEVFKGSIEDDKLSIALTDSLSLTFTKKK